MDAARVETAYHEAGHAVALYRLGFDVESASIAPDGGSQGRVARGFPEVLLDRLDILEYSGEDGREFARRQIVGAFSGVKAIEILTNRTDTSYSLDTETLYQGSDWSQLNLWLPFVGRSEEYQTIYEQALDEADRVLRENWDTVMAVAEALLEREDLDAQALHTLFEKTGCSRSDAPIRRLLLGLEHDRLLERHGELSVEGDPKHESEGLEQRMLRIEEELEVLESD